MISLARSWAGWPVSSWQPKELAFYAKDMLETKQGASHAVICGSQGHSVTLEYRNQSLRVLCAGGACDKECLAPTWPAPASRKQPRKARKGPLEWGLALESSQGGGHLGEAGPDPIHCGRGGSVSLLPSLLSGDSSGSRALGPSTGDELMSNLGPSCEALHLALCFYSSGPARAVGTRDLSPTCWPEGTVCAGKEPGR